YTYSKRRRVVAKRPAWQHRKLPSLGAIKPAVLFPTLDDAPTVRGPAQPVDVAATDVEELDAAVGGAGAHRIEEQRPAGRRVAVDQDPGVGTKILPYAKVRQPRRGPRAALGVRATDTAGGGVVHGRIGREHGVEERPVERVDGASVAGEERVDLEPVRDLLH